MKHKLITLWVVGAIICALLNTLFIVDSNFYLALLIQGAYFMTWILVIVREIKK